MTDHRGFTLVAMGRALFTSNTDEYCIKLKKKVITALLQLFANQLGSDSQIRVPELFY